METGTRISVIGVGNYTAVEIVTHIQRVIKNSILEEKVSLYTYRTYCLLFLSF